MDATPRDFLAIASNYQFFVKSILSLSGIGVKVVYVKGNHDINITKNEIDIIFGEGVVDFYEDEFSLAKGKIFFAHGHNYDLYN
jgi:UDP-2,3-diacylglucosamine pyrophosphatase LpxH